MAGEEEKKVVEDAETNAFRYRTIWTNSLFEKDDGTIRIFSFGRNFRFRTSVIVWGLVGIILSALIYFLLIRHIFPSGWDWPAGIIILVIVTFLSIQIGQWSPMQKYTGEDLITYLTFMTRNRIAMSSSGSGRPASITCTTYAIPNHPDGRQVEGTMYIGTQPLRDKGKANYVRGANQDMEFWFYPRGSMRNLRGGRYNTHPLNTKIL